MKKYLFYISQNYSFSILRPIQNIMLDRGDKVSWFFEGDMVNPDYLTENENKLDSIQQVIEYHADVVIAPANSIPTFIPGLKVAVFHGFDAGKLDKRGRNDHFKIRGCFDLYCTQGPNTTRPFKQMQKDHEFFNVIETGWSTLDPLFASQKQKKPSTKPLILLCSTFSKKLSCAKHLHPVISKLCQSDQWQWLVQFHPKMNKHIVDSYKALQNKNLSFIETDDVIPLLNKADIMVCDTSSVINMFLLQNKPVVTFKNINPGPYLLDINDPGVLEINIKIAIDRPISLMQHIQEMITETHPYTDGNSSQRVIKAIDDVLNGKYPLTKNKPMNLIRNLKFRKRLNYWKFW